MLADGQVTILDTSELDPKMVYAVTLYCWPWTAALVPSDATEPALGLTVASDGDPAVEVAAFFQTFFEAWKLSAEPLKSSPLVLLDRYMMRGDQQLVAGNANGASDSCFLYGFFEAVGEQSVPEPFRPLQPGALVAPFIPEPTSVHPVGPNASEYETAHLLDAKLLDAVRLNVSYFRISLPDGDIGAAFVRLPGGVKMPLPTPSTGEIDALTCTPFDGIPMRAPSAADNKIEVGFDDSGAVVSGAALTAFGAFRRY